MTTIIRAIFGRCVCGSRKSPLAFGCTNKAAHHVWREREYPADRIKPECPAVCEADLEESA